jgi:DHA1 family inner membrane transport protein
LSRGLGVSLPAVTSIIAANQMTGVLGPFFGPFGDHWGYRTMLLIGMALLSAGMLAGAFLPFYAMIMLGLFLAGLGKNIFDPAIQAYVGSRVAYHRRGLVIGIMEIAWAGSSLIGVPLAGLLIQHLGWRSPFLVLGILGLLGGISLAILLPKNQAMDVAGPKTPVNIFSSWLHLAKNPSALGLLCFAFFASAANDNCFVVYGAWFEDSFHLSIVSLGITTSVIGIAELLGEILTATMADRLGLRRSILIGLVLSGLSYTLLPFLQSTLVLAMAGMFLVFLSFEFTIVTALSLSTETVPHARATMMSAFLGAAGIGRMAGALIGVPLWLAGGMRVIGITSALLSFCALVFLLFSFHGRDVRGNRR